MKRFARPFARPFAAVVAWLVFGLTAALGQTALPRAQVGVAYTYTVTTSPAAAAGTVYGASGLPLGLTMNSSTGVISGTPTTAGTSTGAISLTASGVTNSFNYTLTVDAALGTPAITSATTLAATVGTPITAYTVTASNSPTSFNVGALPAGLTFSSPTISGTPTTAGTYSVALSANNATGTGATTTLTITVSPAGPVPAITSALTASATPGTAFTYQITASNTPVSFTAVGLPFGLSLNTTTGVISGTPTSAGVASVTLSATNNNGTGATSTLTLTVGALSAITSAATTSFTVNVAGSFTVTANNTPLSFNFTGLPPGLSGNTTSGVISGTPTTTGTFTVTASANNATGTGPSSTLTLTVAAASGGGGGGGSVATAPVITSNPAALSVTEGAAATFTVAAAGTAPITYQWRKDGFAVPAATSATLTIARTTAADAGSYSVAVANTAGTAFSTAATLTVIALVTPPTITTAPVAVVGAPGGSATFTVVAGGSAPFTYQWRKDGTAVAGATAATLTLTNLKSTDLGAYSVVVTNSAGAVTSSTATLSFVPLPAIAAAPVGQTVGLGGTVTLSVTAGGSGPFTYQWTKDGVAIAGATSATLVLANLGLSAAGNYAVVVTNAGGSTTSAAATLVVTPPPSRLINLATRGPVGAGDKMLIAGFVIQGSAPKAVLIRAVGPTLGSFGVAGTLGDPVLELFAGSTVTQSNDNWTSGDATALAAAATRVGAFALNAGSTDSAILTTLAPGAYTAQVRGANGATGVGLVEIYDAGASTDASRLINVATRGEVGTGAALLIGGFVVRGDVPRRVLIRAVGPALTGFGLPGAVADPKLQLFRDSTLINENDSWGSAGDSVQLIAAANAVGAFGFAAGSKDAALLVTLAPGNYTAQVSAVGTASGLALVEVYEVP